MNKKRKYEVTIQLETTDDKDTVLAKMVSLFQFPKPTCTIDLGWQGGGVKRRKPFDTSHLIEIDVRGFDYEECHHVMVQREGNSVGRRFREWPKAG